MSKTRVPVNLVVAYSEDCPTYVIYIDDESVGRPADRIVSGHVQGVIAGVPTEHVFEFMGEELPDHHTAIAECAREHPRRQVHVGEATIHRATGEIVTAHVYEECQPGPEELVTELTAD